MTHFWGLKIFEIFKKFSKISGAKRETCAVKGKLITSPACAASEAALGRRGWNMARIGSPCGLLLFSVENRQSSHFWVKNEKLPIFMGCILCFWSIFKNLKIFENGSKCTLEASIFNHFLFLVKMSENGIFWTKNDQNAPKWAFLGRFAWLMVSDIFDHFWKIGLCIGTQNSKSSKKCYFWRFVKNGTFWTFLNFVCRCKGQFFQKWPKMGSLKMGKMEQNFAHFWGKFLGQKCLASRSVPGTGLLARHFGPKWPKMLKFSIWLNVRYKAD